MALKWLRKRQENRVAEALRQAAYERQQLLDVMSRAVNTTVFHTDLVNKPGVRNRRAVPTTVSYDHYMSLKRMGATEDFLAKMRPIVKDWPDENPGNFSFHS